MLHIQQIEVNACPEVGCLGFIGDMCHRVIIMVCLAVAHLNDRKPLVVQVKAQRSLILSVVAQHQLGGTDEVERHLKTTHQGDGVFLKPEQLLGTGRRTRQQQHQANRGS